MKHLIGFFCTFLSVSCAAQQIKIIKIDEQSTLRSTEHAVVISRKSPEQMMATGHRHAFYVSDDQGETWKSTAVKLPDEGVGSPMLISDRRGKIFSLRLRGSEKEKYDRISCQYFSKSGNTWSEERLAGQVTNKNLFSPSVTIHPRTDMMYLTWTQLDAYESADTTHKSDIMFSMSKDGDKWSTPVRINQVSGDCRKNDNTVVSATPAVTLDGRIFVGWSRGEKIYLDRSYDKGEMWLMNDLPIANQHGGWSMQIPGMSTCYSPPLLRVDNSLSRFHGSLYMVWSDQKNGANDTDIWFIRSVNSGDYWTQPMRIGSNLEKHQFLPAIAVDQATGYIYIVFYDTHPYSELKADLTMAYSMDGGASFKYVTIEKGSILPQNSVSENNLIQIDAYRGIITPVWSHMENEKSVVCTAIIKHDELLTNK